MSQGGNSCRVIYGLYGTLVEGLPGCMLGVLTIAQMIAALIQESPAEKQSSRPTHLRTHCSGEDYSALVLSKLLKAAVWCAYLVQVGLFYESLFCTRYIRDMSLCVYLQYGCNIHMYMPIYVYCVYIYIYIHSHIHLST